MSPESLIAEAISLAAAPLVPGLIARVKAVVAGRTGPPLLQGYYDLWKLLGKGAVYSRTTSWVFRAGPVVSLAAILAASTLMPSLGSPAPLAFGGDLLLFVYLLGLARFATVVAALDTGSSFEGMGGSREAALSVLVEPALFIGLATVARAAGSFSLSTMLGSGIGEAWHRAGPSLALVAIGLIVILLAENARMPVDDPNTHLELTMIHEVMVLDHGGPDLAFIQYGTALKLWLFGSLLVGVVVPVRTGAPLVDIPVGFLGMGVVALLVGVIESTMARLQLARVPQLVLGASVLASFALILTMR